MYEAIISDLFNVLLFNLKPHFLKKENFKILKNSFINQELLTFYLQQKQKLKLELYLYTACQLNPDNSLTQYLKKYFSQIFDLSNFNYPKNEQSSFLILSQKLKIPCENLIFIDDSHENIITAKSCLIKTILFKNNTQAINDLKTFLYK